MSQGHADHVTIGSATVERFATLQANDTHAFVPTVSIIWDSCVISIDSVFIYCLPKNISVTLIKGFWMRLVKCSNWILPFNVCPDLDFASRCVDVETAQPLKKGEECAWPKKKAAISYFFQRIIAGEYGSLDGKHIIAWLNRYSGWSSWQVWLALKKRQSLFNLAHTIMRHSRDSSTGSCNSKESSQVSESRQQRQQRISAEGRALALPWVKSTAVPKVQPMIGRMTAQAQE